LVAWRNTPTSKAIHLGNNVIYSRIEASSDLGE